MSATLRKPIEPRQTQSGVLPLVGEARRLPRDYQSGVTQPWFLKACEAAFKEVARHKELAIALRVDGSNLTKMLKGEIAFDIRKIDDEFGKEYGQRFAEALIEELRIQFGLDDDRQRLARALDGLQYSIRVVADIARKNLR